MDKPNDFRTIWLEMPVPKRRKLAEKLDTTYQYLQRISGGFAKPSLTLATALKKQLPNLDIEGFERAVQLAGKRMPPR